MDSLLLKSRLPRQAATPSLISPSTVSKYEHRPIALTPTSSENSTPIAPRQVSANANQNCNARVFRAESRASRTSEILPTLYDNNDTANHTVNAVNSSPIPSLTQAAWHWKKRVSCFELRPKYASTNTTISGITNIRLYSSR